MNNHFNTNDSIEQLLRKEADKHRMYPSDKVWENIREELHGKPKWPALFITFISIVGVLTIATIINYPPQKLLIKSFDNSNATSTTVNANKITNKSTPAKLILSNEAYKNKEQLKFITSVYDATINVMEPASVAMSEIENSADITKNIADSKSILPNLLAIETNPATKEQSESKVESSAGSPEQTGIIRKELNDDKMGITEIVAAKNSDDNKIDELVTNQNSTDVKQYLDQFKATTSAKNKTYNSKWKLQFYLTPSVSYRKLEDDKSRLDFTINQADRLALRFNVNDIVKHKASVGMEFGFSVLYELTKNFHLKSGLQFNARQYGIDAYKDNGQATFAYVQNNQLNTVSFQAAYTTKQGTNETKLENTMYQFSMPVGFQWDFINGNRWGVAAAATVQPTYTFNKNVYVVSTDYKYYADGTPFFRRWNVNTSVEFYLTLKSKSDKWFFGPQIRYQQMPTYNDIYPIKEYRVDYGIKLGFIKSLH